MRGGLKAGILAGTVLLMAWWAWFGLRKSPSASVSPAPSSSPSPASASPIPSARSAYDPSKPVLRRPLPEEIAPLPSHPEAMAVGSPALPKEQEPALVLRLFDYYRERFGSYPTGSSNREFMNALCGGNQQRLAIFPLNHPRFNAEGELLDAWGTPFRFHSVSRQRLEVHSAGPDQKFFTEDDIYVPPPEPMPPGPFELPR